MGGRGSGSCKPTIYCKQVGGTLLKVDGFFRTLCTQRKASLISQGCFPADPHGSRKPRLPRNDIVLHFCKLCLFTNKLLIATLHYGAFDRLTIKPSGCHAPIFKNKIRSRKGSVTAIEQFVDELLPRGDIGA